MNILFLSQENPYPPDGGHFIRTYNILKMLAAKNKIFFVATANTDLRIQYKHGIENLCENVDIFVVPHGNSRLRYLFSLILNIFSPLPYSAYKNYFDDVKIKIKQYMSNYKIDLIHVDILPLALYRQDVDNVPNILVNHNVESLRLYRWMKVEKNLFIKLYLYHQYLKLYRFEKQMCPKFERCIVVSEEDQKILEKMCNKKNFEILPNGVDIEYFNPQNNIRMIENSLVWVGGMWHPYNIDAVNYFLDDIFPIIKTEIPEVKVSFIGGHPTSKLMKYSENHPNIKVVGYVEDVRQYMQEASVFIAPIRSGSGTKIKVLNALAMECAVVTTTVGAEGINVKPDIDIMIANTDREFAQKTVFLLRHPQEAKIMGRNGRKVIEKYYSWEVIGEKMSRVYEEVIQR
jgi:glycosyltransferase involved in cell wall biosynthesis